jgi:hypothetical protein
VRRLAARKLDLPAVSVNLTGADAARAIVLSDGTVRVAQNRTAEMPADRRRRWLTLSPPLCGTYED